MTGWGVMLSLTRALQHELGITTLSDTFGPTTLGKLAERGNVGPGYANKNIVRIAKYGLFGKGYWAGETSNGVFDNDLYEAVRDLKGDIGFSSDGYIPPKIFKAILNMDAYVLLSGGRTEVRDIQRWLNATYLNRSTFFVIPCDGHYSRDVQVALMRAIQYQIGIPEDQATGNFGPGTQNGLRNNTVRPGSPAAWVQLFSAACVFNGGVGAVHAGFTSDWDSALGNFVNAFQDFSILARTGIGDYATWAQLLVSTGDPDRPAGACDTRFHISVSRAQALKAAGYHVVGRYLDEDPWSTIDKEIQPGELDAIFAGGMRMFPISQYASDAVGDFTWSKGYDHALRAHDRAVGYGFNRGTVIYFAVDYDATGEQITSNIIPYFQGIQAGLGTRGKRYVAGVYGSRNVCSRVSDEAFARYSFVSGMSWGFSGNLGFPLPANWSFNQIKEFDFNAGGDVFGLDRDVRRGNDPGVGRENVGGSDSPVDAYLRYIDGLYATAVAYGGDANLRVMEYLRHPAYNGAWSGWQILIGNVDQAWIDYAQAHAPARVGSYVDPALGITVNADHFGATANAVYLKGNGGRGDFGGWSGDLATFYGEWRSHGDEYASGYAFCSDRLAKINVLSSFPLNDLVEDVDGYLVGSAVRNGARIDQAIRAHLTGGHRTRFRQFYDNRYGGTVAGVRDAAWNALGGSTGDAQLSGLTEAAIRKTGGACLLPTQLPAAKLEPFLQGYAETIERLSRS
ncbi:peptidoglycan hydrolase-like protein with peptidoglycan-binding domain [Saccharothrix tamanrassetensis]|uniref:Peptidoglycan hydrolase-like protein with peptidoglycan-binding domain n=1 Tax=Saccharothrix tamanrassetensis TaxID=1051531 RepID=A0A841CMU4_9PSEU|nr:glycoside hydrolase domain-containing protein [Saccharothrix tamanrassetensis]MBB5957458.1 peptidoglycan hydrolase-like protein with peptidoglycan-binding domain [Saccharothrix tamanrassetensis]